MESGDITDAWPAEEPPLTLPPAPDGGDWVRMRLHCHIGDPEPGIGDHGEHHLVQLWRGHWLSMRLRRHTPPEPAGQAAFPGSSSIATHST